MIMPSDKSYDGIVLPVAKETIFIPFGSVFFLMDSPQGLPTADKHTAYDPVLNILMDLIEYQPHKRMI